MNKKPILFISLIFIFFSVGSIYSYFLKQTTRESRQDFRKFEGNSTDYLTKICGNFDRFYSFCNKKGNNKQTLETTSAPQKVAYHGPIYNIFFHPLIAYPELAFNQTNSSLSYIDSWFVTVNEFKKIIPEIYQRGFILFSPKDLFEEKKDAKGRLTITRKKLELPQGKKPLILSLDDYNFYNSMKLHGTIHRFLVNKQGRLVTITNRNKNQIIIRDDQEIPQLLEKFITEHPDFSFNKARGIIALTGYNGIFGYNTHQLFAHDYPLQLIEAKKVVKELKEMGWEFASHSYFHLSQKQQKERPFERSETRWLKEVGSIIGPTPYYIFPFGDAWDENPMRMNFLKRVGYKYFFSVSLANEITIKSGSVVMGRFPMDGRSLRGKYSGCKTFINPASIIDSSRLKLTHHPRFARGHIVH